MRYSHLVDTVAAHAQGILERQVCRKRGEPLPKGAHAFLSRNGAPAVDDATVFSRLVQLQARLDDVDGLQAACLERAAHRTCVEHRTEVRTPKQSSSDCIAVQRGWGHLPLEVTKK